MNLSADQRAAGGGTTQPGRADQAGLCQPAGHVGGGEPQAEGGDDRAAGEGSAGGGAGQPGEGGGACGSPAAVRRKPGSLADCEQFRFKLVIVPCVQCKNKGSKILPIYFCVCVVLCQSEGSHPEEGGNSQQLAEATRGECCGEKVTVTPDFHEGDGGGGGCSYWSAAGAT